VDKYTVDDMKKWNKNKKIIKKFTKKVHPPPLPPSLPPPPLPPFLSVASGFSMVRGPSHFPVVYFSPPRGEAQLSPGHLTLPPSLPPSLSTMPSWPLTRSSNRFLVYWDPP
jgi:hypothetical protein